MKFYKFKPCSKVNLDTLERNEIWANCLKAFNDPFEGKFRVVMKDISNASLYGEIEKRLKRRAFFCVCSAEDSVYNQLMWAHYADGHRGFCIEYNEQLLQGLRQGEVVDSWREVYYTEDKLDEPEDGNDLDAFFVRLATTKSEVWEYEKEVRLMFRERGVHPVPGAVSAIYLGCGIDVLYALKLLVIAEQLGVPCYQMEMEDEYYRLKPRIYTLREYVEKYVDIEKYEMCQSED